MGRAHITLQKWCLIILQVNERKRTFSKMEIAWKKKKNRYRVSKGEHCTFVELPVLRSVWNVGFTQAGG